MIALSECPVCRAGQVAFRICGPTEFMALLCGECGLVWMHPGSLEAAQALDPLDPGFARRYPDCDLRRSRWATEEEVRAQGWEAYLLRPGDLIAEGSEEG